MCSFSLSELQFSWFKELVMVHDSFFIKALTQRNLVYGSKGYNATDKDDF